VYQILVRDDCTEAMKRLPDASVHSVVCDPPYHLTSIVERFSKPDAAPVKVPEGGSGVYARSSKGFMGKVWDGGDVAFRVETWREVFRLLKPGGHLLAFGGTRTYHRMACAIEDAGFEIRDSIHYTYGSGFPKSHAVDKNVPEEHAAAWKGWGTALKPAHEIIVVARRPLEGTVAKNCLKHGTGAYNIDACRVPGPPSQGGSTSGATALGQGSGWNAHVNRPTAIDRSMEAGRWPANFILSHDVNCSDEGCEQGCPVAALDEQSGAKKASFSRNRTAGARPFNNNGQPTDYTSEKIDVEETTGGASRYFNVLPIEAEDFAPFYYTAKASRREREAGLSDLKGEDKKPANDHPTVKSLALMEWCVSLVTPPEGVVLDPFMGSGSTGIAALRSGFNFIGMEADEHYMDIAEARIRHHGGTPEVLR